MNTYILRNGEYEHLEDALREGAYTMLQSTLSEDALQALVHDITEYCCKGAPVVTLVTGKLSR